MPPPALLTIVCSGVYNRLYCIIPYTTNPSIDCSDISLEYHYNQRPPRPPRPAREKLSENSLDCLCRLPSSERVSSIDIIKFPPSSFAKDNQFRKEKLLPEKLDWNQCVSPSDKTEGVLLLFKMLNFKTALSHCVPHFTKVQHFSKLEWNMQFQGIFCQLFYLIKLD